MCLLKSFMKALFTAMVKRPKDTDDGRSRKRMRHTCLNLAGLSGITDTALQQVTTALSSFGSIPECTKRSVAREWLREFKGYGTTLHLPFQASNDSFEWHICDLALVLGVLSDACLYFRKALETAVATFGAALNLILYFDEFVPGDAFAPDIRRKCWGLYVSIVEFGPVLLAKEAMWIVVGVLRTAISAQIRGGSPTFCGYCCGLGSANL